MTPTIAGSGPGGGEPVRERENGTKETRHHLWIKPIDHSNSDEARSKVGERRVRDPTESPHQNPRYQSHRAKPERHGSDSWQPPKRGEVRDAGKKKKSVTDQKPLRCVRPKPCLSTLVPANAQFRR